ncbi:glycosyltransferase [Desulfohalobiaceae bacterium Ax17]|uniref:glycosyltransferase n=1 Tax=Desulfovulcanus ferrireducens TaxID=2831190 RepID=UPI00207BA782|nr:glycosyltransferase [Desulfovulcanus ferrireducens]MBT8763039.1 glycosyltransferase [Desulfovulcanus ferrireducens]
MKVALAIRSLDIGGAERQFIELVKHIDKTRFDVTVCTMYGGAQEEIVKSIPLITYYNLGKKGRYDFVTFFKKYRQLLKEIQPDVTYSFLGEMNLFSLWCKPKKSKIIWGFRASNMDLKQYGKVPQILFWLQKRLSCRVDRIIANSSASIEFHRTQGFDMSRAMVIHNGIDIERFKRDHNARLKFRDMYGVRGDQIAIGIVARIDYMKGYTVFAKAMKKILDRYDQVKAFAVGDGDRTIKKRCEEILGAHNGVRFQWLGQRGDVEVVYSGLDIAVSSSSFGEGFSNSIAEAMSCEVPCVVTDVGDSKKMVGATGIVVEPNNVNSLYCGIKEMISKKNVISLGKKARKRIKEKFSIERMVMKTERALFHVIESM